MSFIDLLELLGIQQHRPILALTRYLDEDEEAILQVLNLVPAKLVWWGIWSGWLCWILLVLALFTIILYQGCRQCCLCCPCRRRVYVRSTPDFSSDFTHLARRLAPIVRSTSSGALPTLDSATAPEEVPRRRASVRRLANHSSN